MEKGNRTLYLESIRGLAALAVVFAHLLAAFFPAAIVGPSLAPVQSHLITTLFFGIPLGFLVSGHFAVVIFFVLSGYVLTFLYFRTLDRTILLKQAVKRYVRLAVPVLTVVLASAVLLSFGLVFNHEIALLSGSPEAGRVFNFKPDIMMASWEALYGVFVVGDSRYDPVLWTMKIELLGSFLVFAVAVFFSGFPKRWFFYALITLALWKTYYPCFIAGMVLADVLSYPEALQNMKRLFNRKIFMALSLTTVVFLGSFPGDGIDVKNTLYSYLLLPNMSVNDSFRLWQSLGAIILVMVVLGSEFLQRLLSNKLLVYLGNISFGLYLTHYLVLYSLGAALFMSLLPQYGYKSAFLLVAVVVVIMAITVATVWTRYIDRPTVLLASILSKWFFGEIKLELQPDAYYRGFLQGEKIRRSIASLYARSTSKLRKFSYSTSSQPVPEIE